MADQNPTGADRISRDSKAPASPGDVAPSSGHGTEGAEPRPFEPVPDLLVLAAIQRAQRHRAKRPAPRWVVAEHLGFVHNANTTRRLRPQLESLRKAGSLKPLREHRVEVWALTPTGTRRLAAARRAGRVGELPESPQHREWRHAREEAKERYDDFRTLLYEALEAAEDAVEPATGPSSETLFELSGRLKAAFCLLGSATYCRDEWPEPDDARSDREPLDHPRLGRRNTIDWKAYEKKAKGGSR